jgi:predicted transcriptional regulator
MLHMEHTTTTAERVSAQVVKQIKERGVTVVWLCDQTGIPRSTMLRRLSGRTPFDLNELERVSSALHVPVSDLIAA